MASPPQWTAPKNLIPTGSPAASSSSTPKEPAKRRRALDAELGAKARAAGKSEAQVKVSVKKYKKSRAAKDAKNIEKSIDRIDGQLRYFVKGLNTEMESAARRMFADIARNMIVSIGTQAATLATTSAQQTIKAIGIIAAFRLVYPEIAHKMKLSAATVKAAMDKIAARPTGDAKNMSVFKKGGNGIREKVVVNAKMNLYKFMRHELHIYINPSVIEKILKKQVGISHRISLESMVALAIIIQSVIRINTGIILQENAGIKRIRASNVNDVIREKMPELTGVLSGKSAFKADAKFVEHVTGGKKRKHSQKHTKGEKPKKRAKKSSKKN